MAMIASFYQKKQSQDLEGETSPFLNLDNYTISEEQIERLRAMILEEYRESARPTR